MKRCSICKQLKAEECFGIKRNSPDGLRGQCRQCRAAYTHSFYEANKSRLMAEQGAWRKTEAGRACRAKHARNSAAFKRGARKRELKEIAELSDRYIKRRLKKAGFDPGLITLEIIVLKRQQLEAKRMAQNLRKAMKNATTNCD